MEIQTPTTTVRQVTRRTVLGAAAAAPVAIFLAACSSGASGSGSESKTLTLFTYDNAQTAAVLQKQLDVFKSQTGITVTLDTLPGSGAAIFPSKLRTELVGGKGPDVWRIWGGSIGGPFAQNQLAADLTPYYKQYGWNKVIPAASVDGMTWNGKPYGLPLYGTTVTAWYSKNAFTKAGVTTPPTSYAELTAANDKLLASGIVPCGLGGEYGWDVMRLFEYLLEKNAGPALHDQLIKGKANWNSAPVVQSFTELKEWVDKGWLPKGVMGLDPNNTEPGFAQGKYAYTIAGAWVDSQDIQTASDPSAYSTFQLPTDQTPNRHSGWVEGFMINAASKSPDNAAKLLNFLAQVSTQQALQNTQSTVKGAGPDPAKYPASALNAQIGASAPFFTIQDQALPAQTANTFFSLQSQVVLGSITPAQAAAQMEPAIKAGFSSSGS
ncbi:MAG: extracellular solute-binding protein [Microbacteriaceae bacterium]|nr:extracellular solute-binding protein [Microbacteriaceae bacterium]